MGKAAVDLPDPLQQSSDGGRHKPLTSTDELLAQLAGEEIDRLLAEVDDGLPAAAASSPAAEHRSRPIDMSPPPVGVEPRAAEVDTQAPERSAPAPAPGMEETEPEPTMARGAVDLAAELDEIFASTRAPRVPPATASPAAAAAGATTPDFA